MSQADLLDQAIALAPDREMVIKRTLAALRELLFAAQTSRFSRSRMLRDASIDHARCDLSVLRIRSDAPLPANRVDASSSRGTPRRRGEIGRLVNGSK